MQLRRVSPNFCFNWVPRILSRSADAFVKWASCSLFSGCLVDETLLVFVSDVVALALERVSSCCTV